MKSRHGLIDISTQILKQAGDLGLTKDWVWIITDAQTERVSSEFSFTGKVISFWSNLAFKQKWLSLVNFIYFNVFARIPLSYWP